MAAAGNGFLQQQAAVAAAAIAGAGAGNGGGGGGKRLKNGDESSVNGA